MISNIISMKPTLYLPRKLLNNEKIYSEEELISVFPYVVILAEPGAGKTELMGSLAQKLSTTVVTASKFRYKEVREKNIPLVIDAFDELAKLDNSAIYQLLGKAESTYPTHVYLSSRSSEWDIAATNAFESLLGHIPLIARLCEFDVEEQKAIFEHHTGGEDFGAFQEEVSRFSLDTLLPNPQFLKLFSDAYIESEKKFRDKQSIFSQAVERLAKEANPNTPKPETTLSITQRIHLSSEAFTKILLSGAEGVSTNEASEDRVYPLLSSLVSSNTAVGGILASGLFKPGDTPAHHRPVHKIIAEYCSADYLVKRILNPSDALTLSKCLPVIAPNSTVRDELRGLLGWMAALGTRPIAQTAIDLDPYAVLANGDPSQLDDSSKLLLIKRLKEIEARDPYFRRGDYWRRFSVSGFFTNSVIKEIEPLLDSEADGHLRDLIFELLIDSPAVELLENRLCRLVLDKDERENSRLLAGKCLLQIRGRNHCEILSSLNSLADRTSLNVGAMIIESLGPETVKDQHLLDFFRACINLYPNRSEASVRSAGSRYFVKRLIAKLSLNSTAYLLDRLTKDLACTCNKKSYECECRLGASKVVGSLLDRYFQISKPPYNPIDVWRWIENLHFYRAMTAEQSYAVKVLQEDSSLRRGIISHVLINLHDRNQIHEIKMYKFEWHSHSGLFLSADDRQSIADLAFETDNTVLWSSFIPAHHFYRSTDDQGLRSLRHHMRQQALTKPAFMQEWFRFNRAIEDQFQEHKRLFQFRRSRKMKRQKRKQQEIREKNIAYVQENRELVESGRHWHCLARFSDLVLTQPDSIVQEFGDESVVRNALRNCLDFIASHVPDLPALAELHCSSKYNHSEPILYAACLEILRTEGSLDRVDPQLLKALRTGIHMHYSAVSAEDRDALNAEVDRLVFTDTGSAEIFFDNTLSHNSREKDAFIVTYGFSDMRSLLKVCEPP